MKRFAIMMIALGTLGAAACGGKKDEPKPAPTAASGSAPAAGSADGSGAAGMAAGSGSAAGMAAGSADPGAADEVEVPTDVDFETEAAAKIDEKNVEAQLKALEQELAQ